jgi:hypothetical protein
MYTWNRALRDDNGQPMNKRALRDAVLNLIIAGVSTGPFSCRYALG